MTILKNNARLCLRFKPIANNLVFQSRWFSRSQANGNEENYHAKNTLWLNFKSLGIGITTGTNASVGRRFAGGIDHFGL